MFAVLSCSAFYHPAQLHEEFFQRKEAARLYKAKAQGELFDDRVSCCYLLVHPVWPVSLLFQEGTMIY